MGKDEYIQNYCNRWERLNSILQRNSTQAAQVWALEWASGNVVVAVNEQVVSVARSSMFFIRSLSNLAPTLPQILGDRVTDVPGWFWFQRDHNESSWRQSLVSCPEIEPGYKTRILATRPRG